MKKEFGITLYSTQTVSTFVTVEAETEDEAVNMAMEMKVDDLEWGTGSIDPNFEVADICEDDAF